MKLLSASLAAGLILVFSLMAHAQTENEKEDVKTDADAEETKTGAGVKDTADDSDTADTKEGVDDISDEDAESFFSASDDEKAAEGVLDVFDLYEGKQEPAKEPAKDPIEPQKKKTSPLMIWGSVALGVGGAVVIGGVITGSLALSLNGTIEDECKKSDGKRQCEESNRDDLDKRDTLALTTDILLGVGIPIAVTGLTLVLVSALKGDKAETIALRPEIGPKAVGATVEWRF